MKFLNFHSKPIDEPYTLLKADIARTNSDLQVAYSNLSNVVEPDLIDCYIYQVKAVQMRYNYLITCAKKLET